MTSMLRAAALALAVAGSAGLATPAAAQTSTELRNSKITVGYVEPSSDEYKALAARFKARTFLEELAQFLSPLVLPRELKLIAQECKDKGMSNYYQPSENAIYFCYAFLQRIEDGAPTPGKPDRLGLATRAEAIVGMFIGSALHETGHAVFNMLNVPVFGREEDAADEMAIFIALQLDKDVARTIVKGRARFYGLYGNPEEFADFSDEHGTSSQRFYNFLCLAYGGDPDNFKDIADKGVLPATRAPHCAAEYQKVFRAFSKTVLPFIDREMMAKVRARKWLRPEEMK
jgi:Putative metallopeptidase